MIRHIVMWRLAEEAEGADKLTNRQKMTEMLRALPAKIPYIRSLEVGWNTTVSDAAYDLVLVASFDSMQDLALYQEHPDHKDVSAFVSKIRIGRTVVDYEAE